MIKIQGFIYIYIIALSVFLISPYFPRFTRSRACLEAHGIPSVSRNPVIQSVGFREAQSLSLSLSPVSRLRTMLNRDAGNGDDDEEEWWENEEEETGPLILRTNEERKGGREKDEESEQTDCSNVASPSHR